MTGPTSTGVHGAGGICCLPSSSSRCRNARVYTWWFNDWALLAGWAIGMLAGTAMAMAVNLTPTYLLALGGFTFPGYTALNSVILNLFVAIVLTPAFNAMHARRAPLDATTTADYHV
jgi:solute:Na+ symporter, SSS family